MPVAGAADDVVRFVPEKVILKIQVEDLLFVVDDRGIADRMVVVSLQRPIRVFVQRVSPAAQEVLAGNVGIVQQVAGKGRGGKRIVVESSGKSVVKVAL